MRPRTESFLYAEQPKHDREPKQKPPGENEIKRLSSVYDFRNFTVTSCLLFFGADLVLIIFSLLPIFLADTGHKSDQETSIAMFRAFLATAFIRAAAARRCCFKIRNLAQVRRNVEVFLRASDKKS